MRSGIAGREILARRSGVGGAPELVSAQVPSYAHYVLASGASLSGDYCPTCSPSESNDGPAEHQFTKKRHAPECARSRADL